MDRTRSMVLVDKPLGTMTRIWNEQPYECGSPRTPVYRDWSYTPEHRQAYCETVMHDYVVSNFASRQAKGEVFFNPLTKTTTEYAQSLLNMSHNQDWQEWRDCGSGYAWHQRSDVNYQDEWDTLTFLQNSGGTIGVPDISDFTDLAQHKDLAITKAFSNLNSESVLGLVTLAEADKTLGTISSLTRKALKLVSQSRKKGLKLIRNSLRTKKARRALAREVADLYMEARYGLRPMYYDIVGLMDAAEVLATCKNNKKDRHTVRGFQLESGTAANSEVLVDSLSPQGARYVVNHYTDDAWNVEVRAGVLARVNLTTPKVFGLDLIGPTVWELVPFSFIVDWFWNTSQYVSMWSPQPNVSVLGSWVTVKSSVSRTGVVEVIRSPERVGDYICYAAPDSWTGNYTYSVQKHERVANPSRPILPSWNLRLSPAKLLDLGIIAKGFSKEKREFSTISKRYGNLRF